MQARYWWKHFTETELAQWAGKLKTCPSCKRLKEVIDGFGLARIKRNGTDSIRAKGWCFSCRSKKNMERVQRNHPERWEARHEALKRLHDSIPSIQRAAYNAERYQRNKTKWNQYTLRSQQRYPERQLARVLALMAYPIPQKCAVSDCKAEGERHHPDYTKPLEIVWLCRKHHRELHKMEAQNDRNKINASLLPKL